MTHPPQPPALDLAHHTSIFILPVGNFGITQANVSAFLWMKISRLIFYSFSASFLIIEVLAKHLAQVSGDSDWHLIVRDVLSLGSAILSGFTNASSAQLSPAIWEWRDTKGKLFQDHFCSFLSNIGKTLHYLFHGGNYFQTQDCLVCSPKSNQLFHLLGNASLLWCSV